MTRVLLTAEQRYGKGYKRILLCRKPFLVVKGSRASKKSRNISQRWIDLLSEFPEASLLVVRRYAILNKDSTFATLQWAIKQAHLESVWKATLNPLEMTNTLTKQKIMFRGIDDPESISSITVSEGYLCFAWIEEAFQFESERQFQMVQEMIRGVVPEGYFKQIVLTFNPWNEHHWLNKRFFHLKPADILDETQTRYVPGKQIETQDRLCLTVNYKCNEWLDSTDIQMYEAMRINEPQRYRVAGLGEWGAVGTLVYHNWEVRQFDKNSLFYTTDAGGVPKYDHRVAMDLGFSAALAVLEALVDWEAKTIYITDEIYARRLTNEQIVERLQKKRWSKMPIHTDSEDPRTIDWLQRNGCPRIFGVAKEAGSVEDGIQFLQSFKIVIHPICQNFITEISNYSWQQDKFGNELPKPRKENDHLMDTLRYLMTDRKVGARIVTREPEKDRRYMNERERILRVVGRR